MPRLLCGDNQSFIDESNILKVCDSQGRENAQLTHPVCTSGPLCFCPAAESWVHVLYNHHELDPLQTNVDHHDMLLLARQCEQRRGTASHL